jgi:hypothetical protein
MHNSLDSNRNIANIQLRIQEILTQLANFNADHTPKNVEELQERERLIQTLARELGDCYTAITLQMALDQTKEEAAKTARQINPTFRSKGLRIVNIRFLGGTVISIVCSYYARNCDDKRKKRNKGCYPGFLIFGIYDHCTPELSSTISMLSAALCSYEEAKNMIEVWGCNIDIKTIRNVAGRFSSRARECQKACNYTFNFDSETKGRRIVVSTDGGRVRIRTTKRGPKTKKNRNRYHTDWREPKLMIIYIVDDKGRSNTNFLPIIDGIIGGGPEAVYNLIEGYLKKLNLTSDDSLLFVADGALWIWERTQKLRNSLNLKEEQFYELLDFYHAVEHINDLANLKTTWSEKRRKKWVTQQKTLLKKGQIEDFIKSVKSACDGEKSKEIERECEFFVKNTARLGYAKMANLKFPMGSGAMESAVRRVINLRLKGPGIFWKEQTANEMIMLRSYYKTKRWDLIAKMSFTCNLETDLEIAA